MDLTRGALRHRVRAPTAFTMFFKGVLTTEGLAKSLLPEVDPLEAAQPYVERLVKERWQPQHWSDLGFQNLEAYGGIARRLPISISQFLDDLDHQRLRVQQERYLSEEDKEFLLRKENTRLLVFISLGWMGLSIALLFLTSSYMWGVPVASIFAFLVCFGLQSLVLWRMLRHRG